jgi:GNAT superfamily N-acetyltransferase
MKTMEAADLNNAFEIFPVSNTEDYHSIYQLAEQIIPGFYADHIDAAHLQFFVQRFHAPEEIERQIVQGNLYFLFKINGLNVGYMALYPRSEYLHISKLYLLDAYRSAGLGKIILAHIEEIALLNPAYNRLELLVSIGNPRGIAFYLRNGFVKMEYVLSRYESGYAYEDFRMVKVLK